MLQLLHANNIFCRCRGHLKTLSIPNLVIALDLSEDCIITLLCILESKNLLEIQGSYPTSCVITNCGTEVKIFNTIPVVAAAARLSKGKMLCLYMLAVTIQVCTA